MYLVDTHTHLYLPEFDHDRDEVIQRAVDQGITKFFLPNIDSTSVKGLMDLTEKYPDHCFPMMGLHPTSVKTSFRSELQTVADLLPKHGFYAVGETGIDLYWDETYVNEQIIAFKKQTELAIENKLPLVIHSRNSFDLIADILEEFQSDDLCGIFHSFTGNIEQATRAVSLGFKLGIGGIVTFRNSGLASVIREVDLSHLVLETDSPYLAPVPRRGKRNESAYLSFTAGKIAEITNLSYGEIADITTRNAMELFGMEG